MEVAVKHNSISIHNVVHGVHGKGFVGPVKSIPCRRISLTQRRTPCTASQQAHSLAHTCPIPTPSTNQWTSCPEQHNLLSFLDKCYLQTQGSNGNKSDTPSYASLCPWETSSNDPIYNIYCIAENDSLRTFILWAPMTWTELKEHIANANQLHTTIKLTHEDNQHESQSQGKVRSNSSRPPPLGGRGHTHKVDPCTHAGALELSHLHRMTQAVRGPHTRHTTHKYMQKIEVKCNVPCACHFRN